MTPAELRAALPRTYGPLLARHRRPTDIQLAAAAPLLAGRDVLLCAPTASGKTEAYTAPLVEAHVRGDAPRLLLISPTRALANDLHRRLRDRLAEAGVDLGRWTGETHDAGRLHPVTVLTPEALDARLARSAAALAEVRAVVVDEAHVVDGTARGDQLRVLVQRLRVEGRSGVQVVAASATVADPEALAGRYLVDPVVVTAGGRRRIRARIVEEPAPEGLRALLGEVVGGGFRKLLVFANSREEVETLARVLRGHRPFGDAVFAHHGSLARARRLGAEAAFLRAPAAVCVATSTLELGIDIGDVDLVVLYGVPPDVPSLLQRVGRGGRRGAENHALVVVRGAFQARCARVMLEAAAAGEWFAPPYAFRPGVLVQQALSVLHARASRTVDAGALRRRLPVALAAGWPEERLDAVLTAASRAGWLGERAADGRYGLGPRGEAAWARGSLHGNLAERAGVAVHDALTGEAVGSVERLDGPDVGLGGQGRAVTFREGERAVVAAAEAFGGAPAFGGRGRVPLGAALATAWLRGAGIPAPSRAVVGGTHVLFHGLGDAGGALLSHAVRKAGWKVTRTGRLALVVDGPWPTAWPTVAAIPAAVGARYRGLGRALGMGSFHAVLPEAEQKAAVAALAELDALAAVIAAGVPPEVGVGDEELWTEAAFV